MSNNQSDRNLSNGELERLLRAAPPEICLSEKDEQALWQRTEPLFDRLSGRLALVLQPRQRRIHPAWVALAAAAAVVLAALSIVSGMRPDENSLSSPWVNQGEALVSCVLGDGSSLQVYPNAKVAWSLDRDKREIFLYRGEIFLEVNPQKRPLHVQTPVARVSVLGTRFRVKILEFQEVEVGK